MTAFDLFITLEVEYAAISKEEFVYAMKDLFKVLNHNTDFYFDIKQLYIDYCEEHNICPNCGCKLELVTWEEERSECWGEPCYEMISEEVCTNTNCGSY